MVGPLHGLETIPESIALRESGAVNRELPCSGVIGAPGAGDSRGEPGEQPHAFGKARSCLRRSGDWFRGRGIVSGNFRIEAHEIVHALHRRRRVVVAT